MEKQTMLTAQIPRIAAFMILLCSVVISATKFEDTTFGCLYYLPDNWKSYDLSDSEKVFSDTTGVYNSLIYCDRYTINPTDFPVTGDWTRTNFLAVKLSVDYSTDYVGTVLYYDSSSASTQQSLWAPELFTYDYSDTLDLAWGEYSRFTESGAKGFELLAIGDTADISNYLQMYSEIMQNIVLPSISGLSANALIENVDISSAMGLLTPVFFPGHQHYASEIDSSIQSITISATLSDLRSSLTCNGISLASGATSVSIPIAKGATVTVPLAVTAPDGTKKSYTFSITRSLNNVAVLPQKAIVPVRPKTVSTGFWYLANGKKVFAPNLSYWKLLPPGVYIDPVTKTRVLHH